jgi:DNA-directed RNA polymerase subunit alpha
MKDLKFEKPSSTITEEKTLCFTNPDVTVTELDSVVESLNNVKNKCRIEMKPLERGWGLTLGNSLRRILLSSIIGTAIVKIQIEGAQHEFSALNGVVEDVMRIILNLKKVVLHTDSEDPNFETTMEIHAKEGIVTANDIIHSSDIEVVNKHQYICTVAQDGELNMTLTARRGVGYVGSIKNKKYVDQIGEIAIDSIFTPVVNVNMSVDKTMVEDNANFDKLVLEVETNGSMSARQAVAVASKMMTEHLNCFVDLCENGAASIDYMIETQDDVASKRLDTTIEELDLTVRSYNCLKRAGINSVAELASKSEEDMNKVRNLGRKSLKEIKEKLASLGLGFNKE